MRLEKYIRNIYNLYLIIKTVLFFLSLLFHTRYDAIGYR